MRCLVTGASGHLGAFLTKGLLERGYEVAVLVRPQSDLWRIADVLNRVTIVRGALDDWGEARQPLQDWQAETVFHLAWQGVTCAERGGSEQITRNVAGSLELFEAAQAAGCRTWVGLGSQAEYGLPHGVLSEDSPTQPVTAYGVAKLALGMLTETLCALTQTRFLWVRLLATYGPMDQGSRLIPSMISQLLAGQRPALTPGEQRWDYLYVEEAVDALCRLALETDAAGIFTLGSGEARTVRSLAETTRDLIAPALPLGFGEVPYPPGQIMRLQADTAKLRAATGWQPQISLEEGLRRTIEWHRQVRRL